MTGRMSSRPAIALGSGVVALLLVVTAGCADPNFTSNGEDARRLDLLKADQMYGYLVARTQCEETLARYVPSNGLPLDFAEVERNRVTCQLPNDETGALVDAAEAAEWTPSIFLNTFEFRKKLGGLWAWMTLSTGTPTVTVTLALPEHTRQASGPGPSEIVEGKACLTSVRAKAPPTPSCSLAR